MNTIQSSARKRLGRPPAGTWGDDELKNQLIIAARRLFSERGYSGVSVKDVADACGATPAAIHYHFKSKATLYTECHITLLHQAAERAARIASQGGTVLDRLAKVCDEHVVDVSELSGLWAQLPQVESVDDEFRAGVVQWRRRYIDVVEQLVSEVQSAGLGPVGIKPRHVAHHLIGLLNHLPRWRPNMTQSDRSDMVGEVFTLIGLVSQSGSVAADGSCGVLNGG
ncbi:TetR/AcrR family transcriptional regulator [Specibacter sp. RAF43]|uniref:TetR/AcrR family transcriptional regulator n=1 Tax=Specibacter sp. RAF43 TaxID=3233057 RepID=UPI003F948A1A